ncbi:TetR family transcriptional regulator [Kribbella amoyensis]|uniref:TetR family transcriptional regulator n=1 Tax=Kribbella amoyensis TaxID=996641 RepID=A0A561BJX4_9ACTN|nr:TetR family transcriptional regulator [Kribbella amoyensis]TWD79135.1 TetR family transcriptional regulator [Kribbella amoyensis]
MTTFLRARNDEQRAERRRAILATAATMLTEAPVAHLTLNELSRRVGLAKSNVLKYFESREAVLLELGTTEMDAWAVDLERALAPLDPQQPADERAAALTEAVVSTLAARPMLCDLLSAQAAVLEHNISTELALRFKRATAANYQVLLGIVLGALPELGDEGAATFVATAGIMAGATWTHAHPAEAIRAAYQADPALGPLQVSFDRTLRRTLDATLHGLLPR